MNCFAATFIIIMIVIWACIAYFVISDGQYVVGIISIGVIAVCFACLCISSLRKRCNF